MPYNALPGPGDRELLARARALGDEGETVIADLSLLTRLATVGRPLRIGSAAAGLMILPDIDIGVLCKSLDSEPIMRTMRPLIDHSRVKRLNFVDERGGLQSMPGPENEGIYCGVRYLGESRLEDKTWKLDIWFFPESAPRPEMLIRDRLLAASAEERLAILRIKDELLRAGRYGHDVHGIDVYRAVLDGGARAVADFERVHVS